MSITKPMIERVLEMAYLYCWGDKGNDKLRDDWMKIFHEFDMSLDLGEFKYYSDTGVFVWDESQERMGRPSIDVDVERAIRLRAEGLSYKEIAEKLNQSLALIYSKLPKEVKRLYRNGRYPKVGRPRLKEKKEGDIIN